MFETAAGIRKALESITGANVDEVTLDYMTGMLAEEDPKNLSADVIQELVGPFLRDSGCATDEETELKLCRILANVLVGSTIGHESAKEQSDSQETVLVTPVVLGSLVDESSGGYSDPYLGLHKASVNFNSSISISEALKIQKGIQKDRDKLLRLMREWENQKTPVPPPLRRHGDRQMAKITDVIVESFSISVAGRELLKDASLRLVVGRKYGLVGRNGIGKSTLLGALVKAEINGVNKDITIGCVEQEIAAVPQSVISCVLEVDKERKDLLDEEKRILDKEQTVEDGKRLAWVYQRLQDIDAATAESKASEILAGLGFSTVMQQAPVKNLSGGWRMRVALARALFADADILLLDEPTNHLDLQVVAWLSDYLQNWGGTVVIVSHARHFLNDVCTDIILFNDQKLHYYRGNFDVYEQTRAEQLKQQQRQFDSQQQKRDHMQQFIDRFRYNAKRAALVQSRLKALSKLPMLDSVAKDPTLSFTFKAPEQLSLPILLLEDCTFGYSPGGKDAVLKDVNLSIDLDTRMAVCGVNGSGKSTLLSLLVGGNEPTKGFCTKNSKLRIGFFSQHHVDQLDLTLNSVQQLQAKFPESNLKDEEARTYLGGFGISGLLALEPLYILSGGQKSRVAIALVAFKNPHILVRFQYYVILFVISLVVRSLLLLSDT